MKAKVLDCRPFERVVKTRFHTLPSARCAGSAGKIRSSSMTTGNRRSSPASSGIAFALVVRSSHLDLIAGFRSMTVSLEQIVDAFSRAYGKILQVG